ncbi:MAG: hypothetical protein Q8O37_00550, partial [Sulfuricellaceae bacterium]|nr:hypothetical protein [Sulfuricellaceae bacterium]
PPRSHRGLQYRSRTGGRPAGHPGAARVGRNNQRALRRMHAVQCATLIAPYAAARTPQRPDFGGGDGQD